MESKDLESKIIKYEFRKSKIYTAHLFHFFMTIITGGVWILVWLYCHFRNKSKIKYYEREIAKLKYLKSRNSEMTQKSNSTKSTN